MALAMEKGVAENPGRVNVFACACAIVASTISIIFGYDTGVMSGAMVFIKEEFVVKESQLEILAGILNLCALVGSLCAGRTSDIIGRRYTIILASIIFLLGSVLMGYSPTYSVLIVGRCIAGVGVGFALMIAPVYSAEISTPLHRGFLSSLPELGISIGVLLGYVSNSALAGLPLHLNWRIMLGIAAIPSLALGIGILKMPESPRWLVMQGRLGEARKILYKVSNGPQEAETRLMDIKKAAGIDENCNDEIVKLPNTKSTRGEGVWKELLLRPTPSVRWILLAAVGIHFFEHATGIEAVIIYGPRIFKKAGVAARNKLFQAQVGVGLVKLTCIAISTYTIDRIGRRKLLLFSVAGMLVSLTGLATCLTLVEHSNHKIVWALVLSLVCIYLYVMFFNLGLAPITWVYSSEIFPLRLRAQGVGIGVAVNRLMNATVSMSFLSLSSALTFGGAFYLFAGMSLLAWFFFYFFCPETKGRALEDVEAIFSRGRSSGSLEQDSAEKANTKEAELRAT